MTVCKDCESFEEREAILRQICPVDTDTDAHMIKNLRMSLHGNSRMVNILQTREVATVTLDGVTKEEQAAVIHIPVEELETFIVGMANIRTKYLEEEGN